MLSNFPPGKTSYDGADSAGSGNNIDVYEVPSDLPIIGYVYVTTPTLMTCGSEMPRSLEQTRRTVFAVLVL
jgi:hypothetical protein